MPTEAGVGGNRDLDDRGLRGTTRLRAAEGAKVRAGMEESRDLTGVRGSAGHDVLHEC